MNLTYLHTLLLNLSISYRNILQEINFSSLYIPMGTQTEDYKILLGPDGQNYEEAARYCGNMHSDLFQVRDDMNIPNLFSRLNIHEGTVWTGTYNSKLTGYTDAITKYPPLSQTRYHDILDRVSTYHLDLTTAVGIKVTNGVTEYVLNLRSNTLEMRTICLKSLAFPKRNRDVEVLDDLRGQMLKEVETMKDILSTESEAVNRQLALLPTALSDPAAEEPPLVATTSINQTFLENQIAALNITVARVQQKFLTLTSVVDINLIQQEHRFFILEVLRLNSQAHLLLAQPLLLLSKEDVESLRPETALSVYKTEKDHEYVITSKVRRSLTSDNVIQRINSPAAEVVTSTVPTLLQIAHNTGGTLSSTRVTGPQASSTDRSELDQNNRTVQTSVSTTTPTALPPENGTNSTLLDAAYAGFLLGYNSTVELYHKYLRWSIVTPTSWEIVLMICTFITTIGHAVTFVFIRKILKKLKPKSRVRKVVFDEKGIRETSLSRSKSLSPNMPRFRRTTVTEEIVQAPAKKKRAAPPPPYSDRLYSIPLHLRDSMLSLS